MKKRISEIAAVDDEKQRRWQQRGQGEGAAESVGLGWSVLSGSQTADGETGLGVGWAIRVAMQADENGGHDGTGLAASGGCAGQRKRTAAGIMAQDSKGQVSAAGGGVQQEEEEQDGQLVVEPAIGW